MYAKRWASFALAAIMAAGVLAGCQWPQDGKEDDTLDDDSHITTDENRPGHNGSDNSDDDNDSDDDSSGSDVVIETDKNGNTIEKGDGYTRTETKDGEVSYTVTNAAGLVKWASETPATSPFSVNCTLLDNIDMAGYSWIPVGTAPNKDFYTGTFDGNGKCIENLQVDSTNNGGLFGYIGPYGCVKNLTLKGANISAVGKAGAIVGAMTRDATVMGCTVTNSTITATNGDAGGIVGKLSGDQVIGCMVSNSIIKGVSGVSGPTSCYAGGIVGNTSYGEGNNKIIACCSVNNTGETTVESAPFGGIVGGISLSSDNIYSFNSCYWSGSSEKVATLWVSQSSGQDKPADSQYDGAYKIGSGEGEVTWSTAAAAMNGALSAAGVSGYSYSTDGNSITLTTPGAGSAANQLAGRLGLSWPF